jgi:hypothetical protein
MSVHSSTCFRDGLARAMSGMHAKKMTALLQADNGGPNPILLRIEPKVRSILEVENRTPD